MIESLKLERSVTVPLFTSFAQQIQNGKTNDTQDSDELPYKVGDLPSFHKGN